jgi:hypothetical protein
MLVTRSSSDRRAELAGRSAHQRGFARVSMFSAALEAAYSGEVAMAFHIQLPTTSSPSVTLDWIAVWGT